MRNSVTLRIYLILAVTVLAVAASVYGIVSVMSFNVMLGDIRDRADGVKNYILDTLSVQDFQDMGENNEAGALARLRTQEMLSQLRGVGNLKHLYIAREDEAGELVTSTGLLYPDSGEAYAPAGQCADDLRRSLKEGVAVLGRGIYPVEDGRVYTIYWPVLDQDYVTLGAVCMEFDVDSLYSSYRRTGIYSIALSGSLIVLFSIIAYLSMNRATEPFYKKLAYTDFLTGYENRMAFEQRLRECGALADRGRSVTLLIFDLNNLKFVNDTLGHKQGDVYLKNTANAISRILGKEGRLYRIGGDEFASILVDGKESGLQQIMDALLTENRPMLKDYPFSCACGAATFTKGVDKSLRDVFKRADEAMYEEKKRQKGSVGESVLIR